MHLLQEQIQRAFEGARLRLQELLKVDLRPGAIALTSPVGLLLRAVARSAKAGDWDSAIRALLRAIGLIHELEVLEAQAPALLRDFRRRLRRGSEDEYHGTRCEIATAAALIARQGAFKRGAKGEPDFVITQPVGVAIECTSAHLRAPSDRPLTYKLTAAIRAKAQKPYHSAATVLFLDYTNVLFHSVDVAAITSDEVLTEVRATLEQTHFGALVLLCYLLDETSMDYVRVYRRIDRQQSTAAVRAFLDLCYPDIGGIVTRWAVPGVG